MRDKTEQKYIVVGTSYIKEEQMPTNGRLLIFKLNLDNQSAENNNNSNTHL